jgi:hypothetical protein
MHLLPGTNSTYVMMTRGCMHAPLSIKKVMSMQCVCMHPLAIIIKKYLSTPIVGVGVGTHVFRMSTRPSASSPNLYHVDFIQL